MSTTDIVVSEPQEDRALLLHAPDLVLAEAHKAAEALQNVINSKPKKVMFGGEQYLELEDWMLVGRFYGITAREDGDPEFVDLDGAKGFKASSVAVDRNGREISRATAYCLNDEEKWSSRPKYEYHIVLQDGTTAPEDTAPRNLWVWEPNPNKPGNRPKKQRVLVGEENVPLFQLSSMAQTRANAKVLRNVLAWVVVLAGYRPTPAEELDAMASRAPAVQADVVDADPVAGLPPEAERVAAAGATPNPDYDPTARPEPRRPAAQAKTSPCPHCGKPARASKYPKPGATFYCYDCKHPFDPEVER